MSSSTKRAKLSGAAYRRQREERREANQRSASRIPRFFVPIEAVSTINSIEEISTGPNHEDTVSSLSALGSIDRASFSEESDSLMGSDAGAAETHIGEVDSDIFNDSGVWNIPLSDSIRIEIVSRGPVDLQNKEDPFLSIENYLTSGGVGGGILSRYATELNGFSLQLLMAKMRVMVLGGTVKREAARASLRATITEQILTPMQLFEWCSTHITGIKLFYISKDDVALNFKLLEKRFSNATKISGIRSHHCFIPNADKTLKMKNIGRRQYR